MRSRWDPRGVATVVALAGWAALFWFLLASGRWALYLSTRTFWVVPLGAAALTAATVGRLVSARSRTPRPINRREAWGLAVISLPVVAILALPPATLGAYGASGRSGFAGAGVAVPSGGSGSDVLTLPYVAAAQYSPAAMRAMASRAGDTVSFVGFVTRDSTTHADEFILTRYVITCCIADALAARVHVVDAPVNGLAVGDWVRVTGAIYPVATQVILDATAITHVPRPAHPYLTP